MNERRNLHGRMIDVIAKQLHAFDNPCGSSETFANYMERLDEKAVIERYRNDFIFHAKVNSMAASLWPLIDEVLK